MKQLILATHNNHKLQEIRQMLAGEPVEVLGLSDIGWHQEIIENGESFKENALIKAEAIYKATGRAVLADDSGLTVEALGGAPGVYSSRYMGEETPYEIKNRAIIDLLARVPETKRGAAFVCVVALVRPGKGKRASVRRGNYVILKAYSERTQNVNRFFCKNLVVFVRIAVPRIMVLN